MDKSRKRLDRWLDRGLGMEKVGAKDKIAGQGTGKGRGQGRAGQDIGCACACEVLAGCDVSLCVVCDVLRLVCVIHCLVGGHAARYVEKRGVNVESAIIRAAVFNQLASCLEAPFCFCRAERGLGLKEERGSAGNMRGGN